MATLLVMEPSLDPAGRLPVRDRVASLDEFAGLYQAHSRYVYYLALRFLGDEAQAEDATHDIFLKAFRKLGQFRGEADFRTWLYRIAVNHCRNLVKSWYHRTFVQETEEMESSSQWATPETPLRVLEIKELGQRIQSTLNTLVPEYRLLLLLAADERLSYEEIAQLTEQTADAVRGKLHRARKAFAVQFAKTA